MDKEGFNTQKELWHNSGIANYSYTFSLDCYPPYKAIADVTVIENTIEYTLRESENEEESMITEQDKFYFEQNMKGILENLRIEKVYESIENSKESAYESYEKRPDCYYANFTFEFINTAPFISYYKNEFLLMEEGLVGNGGIIEFKIENFEVLP